MRCSVFLLVLAACAGGDTKYSDGALGSYAGAATDGAPTGLVEPVADDDEPPPTEPIECVAEQPTSLWISPDDSNSMASPVLAREAVLSRWGPLSAVPVRPWEYLNYYTFDYPAAEPGTLRVALDLVEGDEPGEYVMQIGVASPPPDDAPVNVALVIDDSCSMDGDPLRRAADVGRAIAGQLREGDHVSVLTWSDDQQVLLEAHPVSGPDDPDVLAALGGLRARGGTDLSAGLASGYRLLERNFAEDRLNRLVLISDGGANLGQTDEDVIGGHAGEEDEAGIYLVGVGVGSAGSYNDALMDTVTDLGKGAAVFVHSRAEADRMFGERFASTFGVAARDVHIRLDLPPGFEIVETSAEEVSTDPEEVRPQHVAPGDAMVVHQTLASSCGEAAPETTFGVTVSWLDPLTFEPRETSLVATVGELLAQDHHLLLKGRAIVAYAEAVERARDGKPVGDEAAAALAEALAAAPDDADLLEIQQVLEALP